MKIIHLAFLIFLISLLNCATPVASNSDGKLKVTLLKDMPEALSNNAVVEGFVDGKPFAFTFGGIDSTLSYQGIHQRSYAYSFTSNSWRQIADLPDSLGKIASAASRVHDTLYILGGYHVFKDHSEKSSDKVHRYDITTDKFLEDGISIPVPIDDHVQVVWRDSLLYVVSGWYDTKNVANVQIYNPSKNSWDIGTSVPNNHLYKSFGASGIIVGDTIFYFGGASMGKHYPIQNILRKGVINPKEPTEIDWSYQILDSTVVGYRMAAMAFENRPYWLGGSTRTYNYDAIAYDGSSGVNPSNRVLYLKNNQWHRDVSHKLPMDLRGIAEISDSTKIIVGGILENQQVSNKVYLLEWKK